MDRQLANCLKSKSVKNAIIGQISEAFHLTPLLAEAYFNQIKGYFLEHPDISLEAYRRIFSKQKQSTYFRTRHLQRLKI